MSRYAPGTRTGISVVSLTRAELGEYIQAVSRIVVQEKKEAGGG